MQPRGNDHLEVFTETYRGGVMTGVNGLAGGRWPQGVQVMGVALGGWHTRKGTTDVGNDVVVVDVVDRLQAAVVAEGHVIRRDLRPATSAIRVLDGRRPQTSQGLGTQPRRRRCRPRSLALLRVLRGSRRLRNVDRRTRTVAPCGNHDGAKEDPTDGRGIPTRISRCCRTQQ